MISNKIGIGSSTWISAVVVSANIHLGYKEIPFALVGRLGFWLSRKGGQIEAESRDSRDSTAAREGFAIATAWRPAGDFWPV